VNVQSPVSIVRRRNHSGSRRLPATVSRCYRGIETLEPRTLLSGTLSYSVLDAADHALALSLVQVNSTATVQLTDNNVVVAQQALSATTSVAVTGAAGNDALTIDFGGGVPIPSGGLTFTGGGFTNSLVLKNGSFSSETYTASNATSGALNLDGSAIQFSNLGGVVDTASAASLVFTATDAQQQINLMNGPLVNDLQTAELNGGATPGFATIDFANKSQVTVVGGAGDDSILLDNSLAPAGLSSMMLDTWSGADMVNVWATPLGTSTQINSTAISADGADAVTVGNAGSVQGILGSLNVADDAFYDDLLIDDSTDAVGRTINFSRSSVTGIAPVSITFGASEIGAITVNGGTGGNVFNVLSTVSGSVNDLNSGAGNDTVNVQSVLGGSTLNVSGQGGVDQVNVAFNVFDSSQGSLAGFSTILGTVNVFNFAGATTLTLDTTAESSAQTVTIGAGTATVATTVPQGPASSTVNFAFGIGGVLGVKTGAGADTFNVTPSGTTLELDGGDPTTVPGDVLNVDLSSVTTPALTSSAVPGFDHAYTFGNAATINFTHMESWTPVPVSGADLALNFTGPAQVNENSTFVCTFTVTNNGPSDAANVVLSDVLPVGLTFQSASIGSASVVNGTLSLSLGTVANGATVTGTLTFSVADEGATLTNSPSVGSPTSDPVPGNNSQSLTTAVVDPAVQATGGFTLSLVEHTGSGKQTVATFVDPAGAEKLADYSATINWGDGSTSNGSIAKGSNGTFLVNGSHSYAAGGSYVVFVTVNHDSAPAVTVVDYANIADPALTITAASLLNGVENTRTNFTLANFTDPTPDGLSSYHATVNWGDGTTSTAEVHRTATARTFVVTASHKFVDEGSYLVTVSVAHGIAPTATATLDATVSDPSVIAAGGLSLSAQRNSTRPLILAYFVDPAGHEDPKVPGNYVASIDWGDGTATTGTVMYKGSEVFAVTGGHAYKNSGKFNVTVSIVHKGLPAVSVTDFVTVTCPSVATPALSSFSNTKIKARR
jgi:uncharacterized repeat protein (TIGR01451 family)